MAALLFSVSVISILSILCLSNILVSRSGVGWAGGAVAGLVRLTGFSTVLVVRPADLPAMPAP